jgi:NTE family protein
MTDTTSDPMNVDLVLEGGGVKGIALVGAYKVLERHGYHVRRVAGSSAGAIVGTLIASGMSADDMVDVMTHLDYTKFRDENFLDHFGLVGKATSILFEKGIYKGEYFEHWLDEQIGGRTFGTFRDDDADPASATFDPKRAYRLVVMASDISNHRLARLPWDFSTHYPLGAEPAGGGDGRKVSEAVRSSMSIPFFYEPHKMAYDWTHEGKTDSRKAWMVDGGMLSNFPVDAFDRTDGGRPRWPTFGIKLSARPETESAPHEITSTLDFAGSLISTMTGFFDRVHIEDPAVLDRTMFVDTGTIKATDFGLTADDQQMLFEHGQAAAEKFLATWNFEDFIAKHVTK